MKTAVKYNVRPNTVQFLEAELFKAAAYFQHRNTIGKTENMVTAIVLMQLNIELRKKAVCFNETVELKITQTARFALMAGQEKGFFTSIEIYNTVNEIIDAFTATKPKKKHKKQRGFSRRYY